MGDDNVVGWLFCIILTLTMFLILGKVSNTAKSNVIDGEVFKLHDSTYQCKQVQKLEYKK